MYNFQVVLQGSDDIASRAIELLKETFTSLGPKLRASQVHIITIIMMHFSVTFPKVYMGTSWTSFPLDHERSSFYPQGHAR